MATRLREQVYRQYKTLGLTRGEMTILACIADRCRSDGTAGFPGKERIMRETGYCRRWVMICLRRLEAKGCLQPVSLAGGRGNKTSYHIPLNQFGDIVPAPPPPPDEPFLDDQAPSVDASAPAIPETPQPEEEIDDQAADYIGGYTPRPAAAIRPLAPSVVVAEVTLEEMIATAEEIVAARELQLDNTKNAAGRRIMEKQVAKARADLQELQAQAFIQQGGYVT